MRKNIIIIGSGIAGLTLAIALEKNGFHVQLFESAPKLEPLGAGIWMAPNAMQVFSKLGLADEIIQGGRELSSFRICDANFKTIQLNDLSATKKEFGFSIIAIHRGKLQQILLNQIRTIESQCGYSLESFETNGKSVVAKFSNGKIAEGDILIGADGLHSKVRKIMFGDKALRYSGLTCIRGIANYNLPSQLRDSSFELWGGKNRIGFSEISDCQVYWYVTYKKSIKKQNERVDMKTKLIERMSNFTQLARNLIDSTEVNQMIQNDLFDLEPFHPWFKQNIGLIGDAAHPMTPNLGQGGAQAVINAFYLAEALAGNNDFNTAFKRFEGNRSKKVDNIVKASLLSGKLAHMELGSEIRNFILQHVPSKLREKYFNSIFRLN